jgi:creatinine amidohydrolase
VQDFHVCVVNNHLEPEHVTSIVRAIEGIEGAIFANQLTRRWGRTLSDEFRRGDCHAGSYETSLVLAARPELVRESVPQTLVPVAISLSNAIREGKHTFLEMGGDRAYFGTPSAATRDEGHQLYDRLCDMAITETCESFGINT